MKSLFTLLLVGLGLTAPAQLYLNEFVASNDTGLTDETGDFEDWVEIYNAGSSAVSLDGYYLTDDLAEPDQWQLPTGSGELNVPAGGYLVLFFDKDTGDGPRHVNAKLSGGGEAIGLFAPDGSVVDTYTYGQQQTDVSEGRSSDGAADWTFFAVPTPGAANVATAGPPAAPTLSLPGGLYGPSVSVAVVVESGATARYTTNGDLPDATSPTFPGTLTFTQPTALRVAAFRDGQTSDVITETYLVGVQHTFPVVALTAPAFEWTDSMGFYNLLDEDREIPMNAELYESDGTRGFNLLVEGELQGTASLINDQRSIALKAKGSLGGSKFEYRVFPDGDLDAYRSLTLRNSGQDWNVTMFRDALLSELVDDRRDLAVDIAAPRLQLQDYRPSIVYVNGDYWGIYNLRERSDKRYIRANFGYDDDEIDLMDENGEVKEGSIDAWQALQSFLQDRDFNEPTNFAQLQTLVDTDAYLDNVVFNLYIDNQDWPGNNNRHWRVRDAATGLWQWLVKDLDFSFGLFTSQGWNTGYAGDNSLARLLDPQDYLWPNPEWSTRLFQNLVENERWRHAFLNRLADQRNVLFAPARVSQRIDAYLATYAPERARSNQRWNNLWTQSASAERMREFAQNRPAFLDQHVIDAFDEVTGTATVELAVSGMGRIEWSTVSTTDQYTGTYYRGVPVLVRAVPAAGYCFAGWSGALAGNQTDRTLTLTGDITLMATFESCTGGVDPLLDQSISFAPLADRLTTDGPIPLTATASSGLPVGYALIGGPATLNGSTVTLDGTPGTVSIRAEQAGDAQYNAAPPVVRSFVVTDPTDPPTVGPCAGGSAFPWHEWISGVDIGGTQHVSGKAQTNDFSSTVFEATIGNGTPLSLETSYSYVTRDVYYRIYVDVDRDGAFDPATEMVFAGVRGAPPNGTASATLSGELTVPADAEPGFTRIRVVMRRGDYGDPCTEVDFGEVEDYTIDLRPSGTTAPPAATDWIFLDGYQTGTMATLEWSALGGPDVAYYLLETRQPDGRWAVLDLLPNTQPTEQLHRYRYPTGELATGRHTYRVTRVPTNGTARTSNRWTVTQAVATNRVVAAPNPTHGTTHLYLPDNLNYPVQLDCSDAYGHRHWTRTLSESDPAGVEVTLAGPRGVYFLRVRGRGQRGETVRVVKVD